MPRLASHRNPGKEATKDASADFVSLTTIDGEPWFRSVAANPLGNPGLVVEEVVAALS